MTSTPEFWANFFWTVKSLIDFENHLNDQNCGENESLNKENYENVP